MSKTKVRTSVPVAVEEFEVGAQNAPVVDAPIVERPTYKSELGYWWDCLAGLVFLQGSLNVFRSWTAISKRTDIGLAILVILISISISMLTGLYAGKESTGRKVFGFAFVVAALICGVAAFALGPLPDSSLLTYAAIGLAVSGWALRRLLGESVIRSVSLGLVAALPLLFFDGSRLIGTMVAGFESTIQATSYWFLGFMADLYQIPFSPLEDGIKFASGDFRSIAAFGNIGGVLVAIAVSVACSILGKQSFVITVLSAAAAFLWWAIIRSVFCLSAVNSKIMDGSLNEVAMPIYALAGLGLLIIATNVALSTIFAVIPIDPGQFEVSPLTQIYNAFVSFPQLGPAPIVLVAETPKEVPLSKEDLLMDEYRRAKEASLSARDDEPH